MKNWGQSDTQVVCWIPNGVAPEDTTVTEMMSVIVEVAGQSAEATSVAVSYGPPVVKSSECDGPDGCVTVGGVALTVTGYAFGSSASIGAGRLRVCVRHVSGDAAGGCCGGRGC